jgi:RNA polymerase sigma-70 factor (ECF subfamily)
VPDRKQGPDHADLEGRGSDQRPNLYCLIPPELAPRFERTLTRFAYEHEATAILDRRRIDRRVPGNRRQEPWPAHHHGYDGAERRRVRNHDGRRVGERRATLIPVHPVWPLPRRVRPFHQRVTFVEPLELSEEHLEDLDTARLVTRMQSGEEQLLGVLYQRYFNRVLAYLRLALVDAEEAEEATQQVFMRLLEALPGYDLRSAPFRAWLFRNVRDVLVERLDQRRGLAPEDPVELDRRREHAGAEAQIDDSVMEWLTDNDVLVLVGRLPLLQRQVVVLRYMMDLTGPEIAAILDRSPEAIRNSQASALGYLRSRLAALNHHSPRSADTRAAMPMSSRMRLAPVLSARRRALLSW